MNMNKTDCQCGRSSMSMRRDSLAGMPLAMAYVPWQKFEETYDPSTALCQGTIFPELDMPFTGWKGGNCR